MTSLIELKTEVLAFVLARLGRVFVGDGSLDTWVPYLNLLKQAMLITTGR